jgi:hypothetical protein
LSFNEDPSVCLAVDNEMVELKIELRRCITGKGLEVKETEIGSIVIEN